MHNGYCAICHSIELVEATGLKAAGHEQHVCSSCDAVRQAHIEAHPASALLMPASLHLSACMHSTPGKWQSIKNPKVQGPASPLSPLMTSRSAQPFQPVRSVKLTCCTDWDAEAATGCAMQMLAAMYFPPCMDACLNSTRHNTWL